MSTNEDVKPQLNPNLPDHDTAAKYRSLWGTSAQEKLTGTDEGRAGRLAQAPDIADAYYNLITDNYQGGWGDSFHYCSFMPGDTWAQAIARHEHYLALLLGLKPGMRVLDAGCGVGGPARSMAAFAGVHVTGVTLNAMQVARCQKYNEEDGLADRITVLQGDFSGLNGVKLPFPDNHFDAVFAFEALCHAPDLKACYTELKRVCKPAGRLGFFEEVLTPGYDDLNPVHREIRERIERGGGITRLPTEENCRTALKEAGWELEHDEDRALDTKNQAIPWWYPLDGDTSHTTIWLDRYKAFLMKPGPWNVLRNMWRLLRALGLCHPGRVEAIETVAQFVYGCRDGGKLGIFTPLHVFIARKPDS